MATTARGTIVRIKLENFLTYDNVEVRPGPGLNLIVGPNGTGKSTIVCGICLGLAGSPSVLGRSKSLSDYIKHDQQQATIEIDIYDTPRVLRIRRVLRKPSGSEWFLNDKKTTEANVKAAVEVLNIQVDNLCQFLAQDKVVDFSKQSPQELLENMQKAVDAKLSAKHEQLKQRREGETTLRKVVEDLLSQLDAKRARLAELQPEVSARGERERLIKKLRVHEQKKAWLEYGQHLQIYVDRKAVHTKKMNELNQAKAECLPLETEKEKIVKEMQKLDGRLGNTKAAINNQRLLILSEHPKLEQCTRRIQEHYDNLEQERRKEEERKREIEDLKEHIANCERELKNLKEVDHKHEVDGVRRELETLESQKEDWEYKKRGLEANKQQVKAQAVQYDRQLREMNSVEHRNLQWLQQANNDAFRALMFYRENKDKFQGEIYEPLVLTLKLKEASDAKYLENVIAQRDLFIFICENADDSDLFLRETRDRLGLVVNCATVPHDTLYQPDQLTAVHKQLGFRAFLSELFDAPLGVRKFLCKLNRLHRVPVGTDRTEKHLSEVIEKTRDQFGLFLTPTKRISVKASRYANTTSTVDSELREPRYIGRIVSADEEMTRELRAQLDDCERQVKAYEEEMRSLDQKKLAATREAETLRGRQAQLNQEMGRREKLVTQITVKKQTVQRKEQESAASNLADREARAKEKIAEQAHRKTELTRHCVSLAKVYQDKCEEFAENSAALVDMFREKERKELQFRELEQKRDALKAECEDLSAEVQRLRNQGRQMIDKAYALCDIVPDEMRSSQDKKPELPARLVALFTPLPNDIDGLEQVIIETRARLGSSRGADQRVIAEFEDCQEKIKELEARYQVAKEKADAHGQHVDELKEQWLTPLNLLVEKVSRNYAAFFGRLGCAGEVELRGGNDQNDFRAYGLYLKVKFRANEPLKELTAFRQSGGERSVSTILFMLSLQELTRVPFRCVDEINQGMDPENERRVFEMMVDLLCDENASESLKTQYFMLTPKLLPNLKYPKGVMLHLVFNGPQMVKGEKWNVDGFLKLKRQQQKANG